MKKQRGTSMVAVLIGLVIFSMISIMVVEFSLKAVRTAERAYQVQTAQSLMRSSINQLNWLPFDCVAENTINQDPVVEVLDVPCVVPGVSASGVTYTVAVSDIDVVEDNYKTLTVTVGWDMVDEGSVSISRDINLYNVNREAQWDALED